MPRSDVSDLQSQAEGAKCLRGMGVGVKGTGRDITCLCPIGYYHTAAWLLWSHIGNCFCIIVCALLLAR